MSGVVKRNKVFMREGGIYIYICMIQGCVQDRTVNPEGGWGGGAHINPRQKAHQPNAHPNYFDTLKIMKNITKETNENVSAQSCPKVNNKNRRLLPLIRCDRQMSYIHYNIKKQVWWRTGTLLSLKSRYFPCSNSYALFLWKKKPAWTRSRAITTRKIIYGNAVVYIVNICEHGLYIYHTLSS